MKKPDIGLFYDSSLGDELGTVFLDEISHENLDVIVQKEDIYDGGFACLEWFIPPLICAYVAKPYFESFLKEMGKDHYKMLKEKLGDISSDTIKKKRIEPEFIATEGKLRSNNPFSGTFSIIADSGAGFVFKLLLPKYNCDTDYSNIVSSFMDFIHDYHLGLTSLIIEQKDIHSGHVFVFYNEAAQNIEIADM